MGIREHKHPREVGTRDKVQEDEMKAQSLSSGAAKDLAMAVYGPAPSALSCLLGSCATARCWAVSYCPDMNYWKMRFHGFMSWKHS